MRKLFINSIVYDTDTHCEDTGEPFYGDFIYATLLDRKEGKTTFLSSLTREALDRVPVKNIINRAWITEIEVRNDAHLEELKVIFGISEEEHYRSVYERVQHYGGAEEGGWYYHTLELREDLKPGDVELGTNQYGEGYLMYEELLRGEYENLTPQHYC